MADLLTTRYENNKLYRHTGFSATITASLAITSAMGVVWKNPDVYWGINGTNSIKKGTGFTTTVASSIAVTGPVDLDFAGSDLLAVSDGAKVIRYTGFSVTVSDSFSLGANNRGVAWDGTDLITSNAGVSKVRLHSGFSSTVSNSFASGTFPKGVTWDGTNVILSRNAGYKLMSGFSATVTSSFGLETGGTDPYGIDWDGFPSSAAAIVPALATLGVGA